MSDIIIKATNEEFRSANIVAHAAHLLAIRPVEIEFRSRLSEITPVAGGNVPIVISYSTPGTDIQISSAGILVVNVRTVVTLQSPEAKDGEKPVVQIKMLFAAEYQIPEAPVPEPVGPQGISAFAKIIASLAVWPYIRQEVGHYLSSMGIGTLLPLLKIERADDLKTQVTIPEAKPADGNGQMQNESVGEMEKKPKSPPKRKRMLKK